MHMTEATRVQKPDSGIRGRKTMVVSVVLDPADIAGAAVPTTLAPDYEVRLHAQQLAAIMPEAEVARGARILVVEVPSGDEAAAVEFERIARHSFAHIPVVAAVRGLTLADTRTLMRRGAVDVVTLPFVHDELLAALDHARATGAGPSGAYGHDGKVITFFRSVGGVGATAIATQAGCLIAADSSKRVCFLDLDVQFGSAAHHLDLQPSLTLLDLATAGARLDGALLQSVATRHASGLHVIAAPPDVAPLDLLDVDSASEILSVARQEFDIVIVDLPNAWTNWSLSVLAQSDVACLVAGMSVPSIRQARRQIELIETQGLGQLALRVVVNRVERGWLKTISMDETERALRRRVDFCVTNDFRTVSAAIDQGLTLSEVRPKSRVERDVRDMATKLLEQVGVQ